jgi:hypothetical protein
MAFAKFVDRRIIIGSRVADGYSMTDVGLKNLQHVFTVWFPRAVFNDLTEDTVRLDVIVRMGRTSGKSVYATAFLRIDGSLVKKIDYDEDRLLGRVCDCYDQARSGYYGKKNGIDYRVAYYLLQVTGPGTIAPTAATPGTTGPGPTTVGDGH